MTASSAQTDARPRKQRMKAATLYAAGLGLGLGLGLGFGLGLGGDLVRGGRAGHGAAEEGEAAAREEAQRLGRLGVGIGV